MERGGCNSVRGLDFGPWLNACFVIFSVISFFLMPTFVDGLVSHPYEIEVVVPNLILAEGAYWDAQREELLFVDIIGKFIGSYNSRTGEIHKTQMAATPAFIIPVEGQPSKYIVSQDKTLVKVTWNRQLSRPEHLEHVVSVETEHPINRWNECKCDRNGRMWAGTSSYPTGRRNMTRRRRSDSDAAVNVREERQPLPQLQYTANLYRLDADRKIEVEIPNVGISNGLDWSLDYTKFYWIDSAQFTVHVYDFNLASGKLSNGRVVRKFANDVSSGLPDGLMTDANGNLWVTGKSAGVIWNIDSKTGQTIRTIDFKGRATEITNVVFGGKNLDEMYVTTSRYKLTPEQLKEQPDAGTVMRVRNIRVRGARPGKSFKDNRH